MLTSTATTVVALPPATFRHIALGGCLRQIDNRLAGLADAHGLSGPGWNEHVEGALAEAAVAQWLGQQWGIGARGANDVGAYQVRSTHYASGKLIVHKHDADAPYILVIALPRARYRLAGWLWGVEAKQPRYWDAPQPGRYAYCVPQRDLHDMERLPEL